VTGLRRLAYRLSVGAVFFALRQLDSHKVVWELWLTLWCVFMMFYAEGREA
jgi:hypothetical protein